MKTAALGISWPESGKSLCFLFLRKRKQALEHSPHEVFDSLCSPSTWQCVSRGGTRWLSLFNLVFLQWSLEVSCPFWNRLKEVCPDQHPLPYSGQTDSPRKPHEQGMEAITLLHCCPPPPRAIQRRSGNAISPSWLMARENSHHEIARPPFKAIYAFKSSTRLKKKKF